MIDLKPASPGEILQEEFLKPMNVTAYRLAKEIYIPQSRMAGSRSEAGTQSPPSVKVLPDKAA